jgi:hypothetical protein
MFAGEGVIEAIAKHAVVKLAVPQAITPPTALNEVRRLIHALHAACNGGVGVAQEDLLRHGYNRLRPRTADPVNGHGRDSHRQAGLTVAWRAGFILVPA